jgi:hypothetical protein
MDSALVPSGSSSRSFAQQGSVDWVALSRSTFTFSVDVLARFAKAGVEMITVAMGQAIFTNFKLRPDGQQRFSDAIAKLKAFSSYGQILWFGFGVKHIVKILSETERGSACAAMCACLSVSYDSLFSSRVLKALANQQAAPNTLTPSLSQWNALLSVCAGAITDSAFPKLVEGMSRLLNLSKTSHDFFLNEATSPTELASAIVELGRVSKGEVRSVTLLGGVDCGWLAAVSQWLLSLSVDIMDEHGCTLYCHRSQYCSSYAQVVILQCLDASRDTFATTLKQRSFFVTPGMLCFGIQSFGIGDLPAQHIFSIGRSEWTSILHDAFGNSIDVLLSPNNIHSFAHFLYCGFSVVNNRKGVYHLDPWAGISTNVRERQFSHMSFASKRLPELATIFSVGESKAPDPAFGVTEGDTFPNDIKKICLCYECEFGLKYSCGNKSSKSGIFCVNRLAATVLEYIWILSWLNIDEAIYPSATGLRALYFKSAYSSTPYSVKSRFFDQTLTSNMIQLFTGLADVRQSSTGLESARCAGGICVYLSSLKDPTTAPQDQLRATIVPGQIERGGTIYEVVVDRKVTKIAPRLSQVSDFLQIYGPSLELVLIVDETLASNVLEAYILISSSSRDQQTRVVFPEHPYLPRTTPRFKDFLRMIGPADIRRKIVFHGLSSICNSQLVNINALSAHEHGFIPWVGRCFSARDVLWTNTSEDVQLCPRPNEWILVSGHTRYIHSWQEVLRGSNALFYTIICHPLAGVGIRLTSAKCLLCTLASLNDGTSISAGAGSGSVFVFSSKESALSEIELIKGT